MAASHSRAAMVVLRTSFTLALVLSVAACDDGGEGDDNSDGDSGGDVLADTDGDTAAPTCFELSDGSCVEETFVDPPVLEPDADGVYRLELDATEVVIDGQRHCVRAYNGNFLAPTIETPARDGDAARSIRVDLANMLDDHDYRSLSGDECTCRTTAGEACLPLHLHDRCIDPDAGEPCVCTNEEGDACEHMFDFNVTNLHAHGAHVRPDWARGGAACEPTMRDGVVFECRDCDEDVCDGSSSDDTCFHAENVLNAVHPGTGARYRWDLDEDGTHHTGLQWYHPHIHGTTAIQVASGAAGAWIVRGPLDALPGVVDARERVMVFSTPSIANDNGFAPLPDGVVCSEETLTFNSFAVLGDTTAPQLNVINGVAQPRLVTPPGQVERWRIVHTGFLDEVFLGLFRGTDANCTDWSTADEDTLQLTQIGRDGLILPQRFEHPYVFMSPGYRVEAMLGGDGALADGETWCLVAARFLQEADPSLGQFGEEPHSPQTAPSASDVLARFATNGQAVAILNVTASAGPATTTALPDYDAIAALAPSLELDGVPIEQRCADAAAATGVENIDQGAMLQVGFFTSDDPDPCDCANYNVNCRNFEETDRSRYPFDRDLPLGAIEHWRVGASFDGHPFHIHINPYIVCPNENPFDPIPFAHWRDTYLINLGRNIDLITQNRAFTGSFVFHCHKLTHEDHGMMELIRVCDPATDASCGDYDWLSCEPDDLDCLQARAATKCALEATGPGEREACTTSLAAPGAVCAPNACAVDGDCPESARCEAMACVPAPCEPPCGPGQMCVHGSCQ